MTFSHYAGTAIVPTLARMVLCAAFLTAGYNKVWVDANDFTPEQARTLQQLNVSVVPVTVVIPASFQSTTVPAESPAPTPSGPVDDAKDETGREPSANPPIEAGSPPAEPAGTSPDSLYRARGLHHVTLMLHGAGWRWSVPLAWMAGLTEFFGGALLLLGLFSRMWGLGLTIAMGVAFYLTSMHRYFDTGPFIVARGEDGHRLFSTVFSQLGLGILAFGIFLTGAGPLSLDRLIFHRERLHRADASADVD